MSDRNGMIISNGSQINMEEAMHWFTKKNRKSILSPGEDGMNIFGVIFL